VRAVEASNDLLELTVKTKNGCAKFIQVAETLFGSDYGLVSPV